MDQSSTAPTVHTCAISGEESAGKHYILKTTEGEELVCPEALFHNDADRKMARLLINLQAAVQRLEEHVFDQPEPEKAKPEPEKKATAKTAAKAPAQRKAAD